MEQLTKGLMSFTVTLGSSLTGRGGGEAIWEEGPTEHMLLAEVAAKDYRVPCKMSKRL